jgi:hypothetical protein
MRPPAPLPSALQGRVFSIAEADAAGVSYERLRRRDIERVGRGRYRQRSEDRKPASSRDRARESGPAEERSPAGEHNPASGREDEEIYRWSPPLSAAMSRRLSVAVAGREATAVSHETAARLQNLWLPSRLHGQQAVHVSRPRRCGVLKQSGVITHRTYITEHEVTSVDFEGRAVSITTYPRLWAELGRTLSEKELVALGEHLLRRAVGSRRELFDRGPALLGELRAVALSWAGRSTRRKLLRALERMRIGSDSPTETELRLAIVEAGLPEPELQITEAEGAWSGARTATADMGWRAAKVVVQYEGEHHSHQIDDDVARDAVFQARGYIIVRVAKSDRRQGFRTVIETLRGLLAERMPV